MRKISILVSLLALVVIVACEQQKGKEPEVVATADSTHIADSLASCTNPYSDNMKPMAIGMRAMYEQMKVIRTQIERGDELQSGQFAMVDFINAEPTDSSVLTDEFYIRASQFKRAFNELVQPGTNPQERFNTVVNACVQCHMENCPGPLKKIKKLKFEQAAS